MKAVILVVDDEPKILDLVCSYLKKNDYTALCAKTGKEALELFASKAPDLILLDLMLPDFSGENVCRKIREKSSVPIIVMTAKTSEENIVFTLNIGADDYVTKPFSMRELMARVNATLRRNLPQAESVNLKKQLTHLDLCVDTENRSVTKNNNPVLLTPNEYKILVLLMSHPDKIWTRDEIIDKIKDNNFDGFDRTIDAHIKNLRQKICDESAKFIQTVYGVGYKFYKE